MDNTNDQSRVIIALDFDCFYASVALLTRPHLRDKPVAIVQKHLCVTANYVARGLGVKKMSTFADATRVCPSLVVVDGSDLVPFRNANKKIMCVIQDFFQKYHMKCSMEKLGFDEVFIDVSSLTNEMTNVPWKFEGHVHGNLQKDDDVNDELNRRLMVGSHIAQKLRESIRDKTDGLTCCAGISTSKLLSKLVAGVHKPNEQTTLLPINSAYFVSNYSPIKLPWLGKSTIHALEQEQKFKTVGEIANRFPISSLQTSIQKLRKSLQSDSTYNGLINDISIKRIIYLLHGIDNNPIADCTDNGTVTAPKSISVEDACRKCNDMQTVKRMVHSLAVRLVNLLIEDCMVEGGRRAQTISVGFRKKGDGHKSTWKSRKAPVEVTGTKLKRDDALTVTKVRNAITDRVLTVLKEDADVSDKRSFQLTLIGVGVSNFIRMGSSGSRENVEPLGYGLQQEHRSSSSSNESKVKTMDIASFFSAARTSSKPLIDDKNKCRKRQRDGSDKIPERKQKPKASQSFFTNNKQSHS